MIHYWLDLVLFILLNSIVLFKFGSIVHDFIIDLFIKNPIPTPSLFCLLSPIHLKCCILTFSLSFKSVSVIANMWHGFDIIYFNDCILDLIPLALAYIILNLFLENFPAPLCFLLLLAALLLLTIDVNILLLILV